MNIDGLVCWIEKREAIRVKKEAGAARPWSDDPILNEWSFCNVRREDDRTTKWVAANWREPHADDPDVWHA
jgi:5-hmdU DNA kinase, helical domain